MSGVTTPPKASPSKKAAPRALNVGSIDVDAAAAASASANNGAIDPRSPGVPRTPSGVKNKKTFAKTPNKNGSSGSLYAVNENGGSDNTGNGGGSGTGGAGAAEDTAAAPASPLADFITQTDASGTPTHHRGRKTMCTQCGKPMVPGGSKTPTQASSGKSGAAEKGDGNGGSSICCCFQKSNGGAPGSPKAQYPGSPTGKGNDGKKGFHSPKGGKKKGSGGGASPFNTFHYDDPAHPADQPILPPVAPGDQGKLCLVLDLDETLVHSSFRAVPNPDYIIPVQIEDVVHHVYVCKRPGVDEYLRRCGERYEVVVYTASLNKYADPLLDKLDVHKVIRHRLFRESCTQYQGNYVKNLSLLGRDLETCIIVDNSPLSYLFHPENAIGCTSWIDQPDDDELRVIQDFCERIEHEEDIRYHMRHWRQGKSYEPATAYAD